MTAAVIDSTVFLHIFGSEHEGRQTPKILVRIHRKVIL